MWALATLEASAVSSRSRVWFQRYALAAVSLLLLLGLAIAWLPEDSGNPDERRELGRHLACAMSLYGYIAAAVLAPLLAAGAVEAARRTGMLDLLIASPVPERRILAALACGRLLATAQFFVPAIPLVMIPIYLAGSTVMGGFLWSAVLAAFAACLSTSFAFLLASSGRNPAAISGRLLTFIVFTPAASITSAICFLVLFLGSVSGGILEAAGVIRGAYIIVGLACLGGALPFWGLGAAIFVDVPESLFLVAGAAIAGLVTIRLAHDESSERFAAWVERLAPPVSREGRSYSEAGAWRRFLPSLARRAESVERKDEAEGAEDSAPLTSLARSRLLKSSGLENRVYYLTGRNPFVLRRILGRIEENSTVGACFGILALYIMAALEGSRPGFHAMGLGLLLAAYLSADEVARLLPSRSRAGLWQSLLSSPLAGHDVVIGGAASVFIRIYPLLAMLFLVAFLPVGREFDLEDSAAFFALVVAAVVLACGISLWVSLVLERRAERMAALPGGLRGLRVAPRGRAPPGRIVASAGPEDSRTAPGRGVRCGQLGPDPRGVLRGALPEDREDLGLRRSGA
jgi:hypothetical protein